jgi:glutathionyl-hydroquinone reductase
MIALYRPATATRSRADEMACEIRAEAFSLCVETFWCNREGRAMLVNGHWSAEWHPVQATDSTGGFVRQVSSFRNWITPDGAPGPTGDGGFAAERDRYHLFVALICPWASRTLIARALKRLSFISVSVVEPTLSEQGWRFGSEADPQHDGATRRRDLPA